MIPYAAGERSAEEWAERNGCDRSPVRTSYGNAYCEAWSGCDEGAAVELCTLPFWTHLWPTENASIPASSRIWEFFQAHPLE